LVLKTDLARDLSEFKAVVKKILERAIDAMKTSAEDIPVLLVGGGAIIAPDELSGASKVVKPEWSGVANAIGAATARVSGIVDTIESTENKSSAEVMEEISKRAIQKAIKNGANPETVQVVEMDHLPLQVSVFFWRSCGLKSKVEFSILQISLASLSKPLVTSISLKEH
jgi:N-methylhydantoinase A/oxoprolinase/acetone carboxylase beta subunit